MNWITLGTVQLNYEWQTLAVPNLFAKTFRLTHNGSALYNTRAIIAQSFGSSLNIYRPRAFYFSKTPKIYRLYNPEEFIVEGFSRIVALRLSPSSRVFDFNWRVTVEAINVATSSLSALTQTLQEVKNQVSDIDDEVGILNYTANRIEAKVERLQDTVDGQSSSTG